MKVWSDRGSTCKFRNARSAFRNLHVDPLSLHTFMMKQTSRIQSLYLYFNYFIKIVPFWLRNIRFLIQNTPVIILRVSLFAVTPSHVASTKIECQNFSYVYRSRKHWECKYWVLQFVKKIYSIFHIVQRSNFLEFFGEYCEEKSNTFT